MKKVIIILILISIPLFLRGQITDITVSDDLNLNKVYFGIDAKTSVNVSNLKNDNIVSLQSGVLLTYSLNSDFSIRSQGAVKVEGNKPIVDNSSFEIVYNGLNNLSIHLGVMATPTTKLRPNPITWQSQTESNAQSNIIGGRTGVKVKYIINSDLKVIYGFFNHDGIRANHLRVNYKAVNIAGYIEGNKIFYAADYNTQIINSTLTFVPSDNFSQSILINLKNGYSPLLELEYCLKTKKMTYGNIGLRKYFTSKYDRLKGFLSISYNSILNNQILGRFAIHI